VIATDTQDLADIYSALDRWLREAARARKLRTLTAIELRLEAVMSRFFRYQARTMRVLLEAARVRRARAAREAVGDPPVLDWEDPWMQTRRLTGMGMVLALEEALQAAVDAGIIEANVELGASFALENPRAVTWIAEHAATAITGINATTEEAIRGGGAHGRAAGAAGDSYATIARAITDELASYAEVNPDSAIRSRAHMIAVTEMGNGYVQGNVMVADALVDAGVDMEKSWLAADDPCDICAGDEDDGWIPYEDTFSSGDDEPLAHPNCRCDLLTRAVGTASALDSEEG